MKNNFYYPLTKNNFTNSDIAASHKVLVSKNLTMGSVTSLFENHFSKKFLHQNSIMVNSGSSANLLIFQTLINPNVKLLKQNDEVLIPAICWSTSLWPIIQSGLKPVFVDIDLDTLNISINDLKKKITKKTKALMLVHALGNSADMDLIKKICKINKLILIEDTCEALGSKFKNKLLGTFGEFSSFSTYYSHHITSVEGGFVSCKNNKFLKTLKVLRSHGWEKEIVTKKNNNWKFINSGFNFRPTDITASIGLNQMKRLNSILLTRKKNFQIITNSLKKIKNFNNIFNLIIENKSHKNIAWFGIPIKIKNDFIKKRKKILNFLNKKGIETRPIISGNFSNQPAAKLYKIKSSNLINANIIERSSFFIGIHNQKISTNDINKFCKVFKYLKI